MKSVLISIKPKWCELIVNGKKTIEVRKSSPKIDTPFKCYIYCTLPRKKVIGEFVCDKIKFFGNVATDKWKYLCGSTHEELKHLVTENACLTEDEMIAYGGQYGWHISELVIYDSPKELSDFNLKRPPQSWCYVEE